jgi:F0F1-type ATP synthase delta subunit
MAKSARRTSARDIVEAHPKVKEFLESKSYTPEEKEHVVKALVAYAGANPTRKKLPCGDYD